MTISSTSQILFIDAAVAGVDTLLASIDPSIEVIRLNADEDGLTQIARALAGRTEVGALHVISHGEAGALQLGNGVVDLASIDAGSALMATIRGALAQDADLLLYGCDVAEGETGAAFIAALAEATGADVAASVDVTGNLTAGADWELEAATGIIETAGLSVADYQESLALVKQVTVSNGAAAEALPFASGVVNIGFFRGSRAGSYDNDVVAYYNADPAHYSTTRLSSITSGAVSNLKLLFIEIPDAAFNATEIGVLQTFLDNGGRIMFVGEHNGYSPTQNGYISQAITQLGGSITITTLTNGAAGVNDTMHDNVGGYIELSDSPLMAGVTSFRTAYFAPLQVEDSISKAVMVTDESGGNGNGWIAIADQALSKGRVTVIADVNWMMSTYMAEGNRTFLHNLAANSAANVATVASGGDPNAGGINAAANAAPTLTSFASSVDVVNEDNTVELSFTDLQAQADEADDGTVDAFVIKAVSSGTLLLGTSLATATAWIPSTNDAVTSTVHAYWTPAANANGTLNAFTVVARDNAGTSSATPVQVTVSVTAVNDAPTLSTNATLTPIAEDVASADNNGSTIGNLFGGRFSDVDAGQTLGGVIVTGNTANAGTEGSWQYLSGGVWRDIGSVSDSAGLALSAGTSIRFAPVSNYNGTPPSLTVHGTDSAYAGGYTSGASAVTFDTTTDAVTSGVTADSKTLGITVSAVNDAPVIDSDPATDTVEETSSVDTSLGGQNGAISGTLTAVDVESASNLLTFGIRGGTDGGATWTKQGMYGLLTVNETTGAWTYVPNQYDAINALPVGASVSDGFDFKVTDPAGAIGTQSLSITLTGSNDLPQLASAISDQTFSGAGSWTYQIPAATFTDAEGTGLAYTVEVVDANGDPVGDGTLGSNASWLSFDEGSRTFTGNPPVGWANAGLHLKVTATDDQGESVSDTFSLTLSGTANQPPVVAAPLTWHAEDAPSEVTAVTFTGALGGTSLTFDGTTVTLGTTATGSDAANAVVAAFAADAALASDGDPATTSVATYTAAIKAGVGNENTAVLTANSGEARTDFTDGAVVSLSGGSYTVNVVTEGVTATAETATVQFTAPPAGASSLSFDGLTISLAGISTASGLAAAVASAVSASGSVWNAVQDGTLTDQVNFTARAPGDLVTNLTAADFEVVATTAPLLATTTTVQQQGTAGSATQATVYFWTNGTDTTVTFDGVDVLLLAANSHGDNAAAFAAATFPNWTVVDQLNGGQVILTAKTASPVQTAPSDADFTGSLAQVLSSNAGSLPAAEVVDVTFDARPAGVTSLDFDGLTIDLSGASTAAEVAAAVHAEINANPATSHWSATVVGGVLTLTADANEARTNLSNSDFTATAVNNVSLASSVAVSDGLDAVPEVVELTFTPVHGGQSISLDGVDAIPGTALTADDVATAVAAATFTDYTTSVSGDTVTFTAITPGSQSDIVAGDFTGTYNGTVTPSVTTDGSGWTYQIPVGTFTDPEGDVLTYAAYTVDAVTGVATLLVDSAALSFDESTATLSGNGSAPSNTLIEIRATDASGSNGTAASQFQLVVYNDSQTASLVAGVLPASVSFVNGAGAGSYAVPATAFNYLAADTGALTYTATLADGVTPLPAWLHLDPATGVFSGNPPAGSTDVSVKVTATAPGALTATTAAITLTVGSPNDALVLTDAMADQQVVAGGAVSISFVKPFTDPDGAADGTATKVGITYEATANGHPLSDYGLTLTESGGNLVLTGNVPGGTPFLNIVITGTDASLALSSQASTSFTLNLADAGATGVNVAALSANNAGAVTIANQTRPGLAPQQGDVLWVDGITDEDGYDPASVQTQWQVSANGSDWSDVTGSRGTAATLTLAQTEVGLQVRAQVFYLDGGLVAEAPVSNVMPAITDVADAGTVVASGSLQPGQTLSAIISDADGLNHAAPTYVWQRSSDGVNGWAAISGATYASYTLDNADGGKYLRVVTSYQDDAGFTESSVTSVARGPVNLGAVAPVATDDTASVTENSGLNNATAPAPSNIVSPITGNLVGNDSDSNAGDSKTVTSVQKGSLEGVGLTAIDGGTTFTLVGTYGTLVVTKATGAYQYTLNQDATDVQRLNVGSTPLTDTFNYTVTDNDSLSDTAVLTITINGANDLPLVSAGIEATATVVEDVATALPIDFLEITEWDSNSVSLRLTVDHGTLRASTSGGVTVSGSDSGTVTLTASDSGTLASWLFENDVLYVTAPNSNGAVATLTYETGDGAGFVLASGTTAITATTTNDAPIVDANGASAGNDAEATFRPRGSAVAVAADLVLSDIDSGTLTSATVTLATGASDNQFGSFYETLSLSAAGQTLLSGSGLSLVSTPSINGAVLTLTGTATLATYQAVLREVLYNNSNTNAFAGDRTVTISVTDAASATSNTASFATASANALIAVGQRIFIDGVDSGHLVAEVLDDQHFVASGALGDLADGIDLSFQDDTGVVTTAVADGPLVATTTVHVPWTPVIDMNGSSADRDRTVSYIEGQGALAIATSDASITDQGGLIRSLTVALTNAQDNGVSTHETLAGPSGAVSTWLSARLITFSGNGSGANGLTGATQITFTASGAGSDATNFQVALRAVTYQNTSQNPDTTQRVIQVTSMDVDGNAGVEAHTYINPVGVNDAPDGINSTVTAVEDNPYTFAAANFGFSDLIDDADGAPNALTAVKISTLPASGTLLLDGVAVIAGRTVSLADIHAGHLTYVPAANQSGLASTTFDFQVQDNGGTSNGGVDLDPVAATMTIDITPANDAPVLTANGADLTAIDENATSNAGQSVASLLGTIADVDSGTHAADNGTLTGIAVHDVSSGDITGTWQYKVGVGSWTAFDFSGANAGQALLLASTDLVRFVPDAVGGTTASTLAEPSLRYYAWDQSTGTAGTLVSTATRGGSTALSSVSDTVALAVTDVNDAPTIAVPAAQTVAEDGTLSITGVSFGDVDITGRADGDLSNDTVTVSLSVAHGTLTLASLTGVTVSSGADGSDTMTLQGTLAAINAAVATLDYRPTGDYTGADSLSLGIDDGGNVGSGGALTASTTLAITVTGVNDAPVLTAAAPVMATLDEDDITNTGSLISDLVNGANQTGISDVDTGAANEFSGQGIAVHELSLSGPGEGRWQYTLDGSTWTDVGVVDATHALLLESSDSLRFVPDAENAVGATASYYLWDGATGTAGGKVDVSDGHRGGTSAFSLLGDAVSVTVTAVNDAPTVDLNGGAAGTGDTIVFSPRGNAVALFDSRLTLGDVDDGDLLTSAELVMDADDTLDNAFGTTYETLSTTLVSHVHAGSHGDITISGNGTAADPLVLSGTGTAADYKAALLTLVYENTNPNAFSGTRAVSVTVHDAATTTAGTGATNSVAATLSIAVNWGAVADLNGEDDGRDHAVTYTEDTASVAITASDASLTDQDGNIASVTITLTNRLDGADERLYVDPAQITAFAGIGITISGNNSGAITLSGDQDGTYFQLALRAIRYINESENPSTTPRVVTVESVDVDGNIGVSATTTINLAAINDAPVGADATITLAEDTSKVFSAADFAYTDLENHGLLAVKITTLPVAGALTLDGVAVTVGQEISAADLADGLLVFTPAADANGLSYASLGFQVRDDGGTANGGIDLAALPHTLTLDVTAVNDLPAGEVTISGTVQVGALLTADVSAITDVDGLAAMTYQWQTRVLPSGAWTDVAVGGTSATYTLDAADINEEVRVLVSYDDAPSAPVLFASDISGEPALVADANGDITVTLDSNDPTVIRNPLGNVNITNNGTGTVTVSGLPAGATVTTSGTGPTVIDAPQGDVTVNNAGPGTVTVNGLLGTATLHTTGSGPVTVASPADGATVDNTGTGVVTVTGVTGTLHVTGTGPVTVASPADGATVDHTGTGTVTVTGVTDTLNITGTGPVTVASPADGASLHHTGTGTVTVTGASGTLDTSGTGPFTIDAPAAGTVINDTGSGAITVNDPVGDLTLNNGGGGTATVNGAADGSTITTSGPVTIANPDGDLTLAGTGTNTVTGLAGTLNTTGSGPTTVDSPAAGSVINDTGSGAITVNDPVGDLTLNNGGGGTATVNGAADGSTITTSGPVTIANPDGDLTLAGTGTNTVTGLNGTLNTTGSGPTTVDDPVTGSTVVSTGTGAVTVTNLDGTLNTAGTAGVSFDAPAHGAVINDTGSGAIDVTHPVGDLTLRNGGGGSAVIHDAAVGSTLTTNGVVTVADPLGSLSLVNEAGDTTVTGLNDDAVVNTSGAGATLLQSPEGDVVVDNAGSGTSTVSGLGEGHRVTSLGAGPVLVSNPVGNLALENDGSGLVTAQGLQPGSTVTVAGDGDVAVDLAGFVPSRAISIDNTGDAQVDVVNAPLNANVRSTGEGDVTVVSPTGSLTVDNDGQGLMTVSAPAADVVITKTGVGAALIDEPAGSFTLRNTEQGLVTVQGLAADETVTLQGSGPVAVVSGLAEGEHVTVDTSANSNVQISNLGAGTVDLIGGLALDSGDPMVIKLTGNGTTPLNAVGTVALNGTPLTLDLDYTPALGDQITLLANDGGDAITGTFAGKPEGASFYVEGQLFRISYAGGSGNDVVLTRVNDAVSGSVTISGTPIQGGTLTVSDTLADTDGTGTVSYQWLADGQALDGATGSTLTLGQDQVGQAISVRASLVDGLGSSESSLSGATAPVANVNDAPTGALTLGGSAEQGGVLTVATSLADLDGMGAISYQWLADGEAITGATAGSLTLGEAQVGKVISVEGRYTDGQGSTERVRSGATVAVANVNDAVTGTVAISGTPTFGQTLVAAVSLSDLDGAGTYAYQWLADGAAIAGATQSSHRLQTADIGKAISLMVSYVDGHGQTETVTSTATAMVADGNGVAVVIEAEAPSVEPDGVAGDGNGDGVQDSVQADVVSAPLQSNDGATSSFVTLVVDSLEGKAQAGSAASLQNFTQISVPVDAPSQAILPAGQISFEATVETAGITENFSLYVDASMNVNGYWKQNADGVLTNLASEAYGGKIVIEGDKIRLDFVIADGGEFDADHTANGVIVDPGAVGFMPLSLIGYAPDAPSDELKPGESFWG
ncbi:uncharacterized protein DUF4347 [Sphaerotilus hippei]|uniref:Uncharacterized protein DUF4347 n=1 Tax=Sphaerotilus hippei TaxID=744406 RepID=A0A318H7Y3_9BURK|nr:DUF4347 domain-containing protein [Sphaerotilus hippei]PXW94007.1 uncharacterized protein DUF4347 [Sphaerotilus hippei]